MEGGDGVGVFGRSGEVVRIFCNKGNSVQRSHSDNHQCFIPEF